MFDHSPPADNASAAVKAAYQNKCAAIRAAIESGDRDKLRSLSSGLPEDTKWVSFNDGSSYWQCDTNERLVEIGTFLTHTEGWVPFSVTNCVEATLEAERQMYR
jgi:hypothetical protein